MLLAAAAVLARVRDFAWRTFFVVGGWALAAYLVIAGMLEFVFVLDHTRGSLLIVLTLMLAVYAVNVPLLLAFSVARYQPGQAHRGRRGCPTSTRGQPRDRRVGIIARRLTRCGAPLTNCRKAQPSCGSSGRPGVPGRRGAPRSGRGDEADPHVRLASRPDPAR